jgi:predicted O-methyltransferase YrrM
VNFTTDWVTRESPAWSKHVLPLLPETPRWLEIGSFEGRSACWMLDNVPGIKVTCVDPFFDPMEPTFRDYEARFDANTAGRVEKVKSRSFDYLVRAASEGRIWDGCYIDGDHEAKSVLEDFVLAWHCVAVGGLIVLDDYQWSIQPHRRGQLPPAPAIDSCLNIYGSRIEVLHKSSQAILRKVQA